MNNVDKNGEFKALDIFGIKPVSDAINTSVTNIWEILNLIFIPSAKELGFILRYKIKNFYDIKEKTKKILNEDKDLCINTRILFEIIEKASLTDDGILQEKWAGLLASSCTKDGKDESNLIFINLLSQLTHSEVKILDYICNNAKKLLTMEGLAFAENFDITIDNLLKISDMLDIYRLDLELDHLRELGLITRPGGFIATKGPQVDKSEIPKTEIGIAPSGLALNLYVRCKGSLKSSVDYFELK